MVLSSGFTKKRTSALKDRMVGCAMRMICRLTDYAGKERNSDNSVKNDSLILTSCGIRRVAGISYKQGEKVEKLYTTAILKNITLLQKEG